MLAVLLGVAFSLDNGLALTPPMGWMAWEQFHCENNCEKYPKTCISEQLFIDMIDHLAGDGWLEFGYEYINIDDCWMGKGRDANGKIYADQKRFPHGIAWLADYAHKKGVKLGIYNDYGTLTCGGYTGSEGYLRVDAHTFAEWKVDMLKMDGCYSHTLDMADSYPAMMHFLNETGRPIMYSCSWPAYDQKMNYGPLPPHCNLWRNYGDIQGNWNSVKNIMDKWGNTPEWIPYAGPGHWNDPDQLVIGMQKNAWTATLNAAESRTQMSIWSILAAPLIMSNDLRNISTWAKEVLTNKEVIAVDQDKLGKQGRRVTEAGNDAAVWVRELEKGEYAVALQNRGDSTRDITVKFNSFTTSSRLKLRDLWQHKDIGEYTSEYTASSVPAHDVVFFRATPQ
jgi:alpha-N-acetylgalactosaminidase